VANLSKETLEKGLYPKQLVYDVFVNGEYRRTFVNDIQIDEFSKQIHNRDELAEIIVVPEYREYVEVR
jgi:ribosomal protein L25 (general stress protein Ctc)